MPVPESSESDLLPCGRKEENGGLGAPAAPAAPVAPAPPAPPGAAPPLPALGLTQAMVQLQFADLLYSRRGVAVVNPRNLTNTVPLSGGQAGGVAPEDFDLRAALHQAVDETCDEYERLGGVV